MPKTPRFKIYRDSEYVGSAKYAEDAAALIAVSGCGEIRDGWHGRRVLWREGREEFSASDSYDMVARVVARRIREHHMAYLRRYDPEFAKQFESESRSQEGG